MLALEGGKQLEGVEVGRRMVVRGSAGERGTRGRRRTRGRRLGRSWGEQSERSVIAAGWIDVTAERSAHGLTFPVELVLLLSMVDGRSEVRRVVETGAVEEGGPIEDEDDDKVVVVMVVNLEERDVDEVVEVRRAEGPI